MQWLKRHGKIIANIIVLSVLVVGIIICYFIGDNVDGKKQLDLFKSLRDSSAAIFTVVGIWMALICPDAIKKVYSDKNSDVHKQMKRIKVLLLPLILAAVCIFVAMSANVFVPAIKDMQFCKDHIVILKKLSYTAIFILYFVEIWSLLFAIIPAIFITDDINSAINQRKLSDAVTPPDVRPRD